MVNISRSFLVFLLCLISFTGISQNKPQNDARSRAREENLKKTLKWIQAEAERNSKNIDPKLLESSGNVNKNKEGLSQSELSQTDSSNKSENARFVQVLKSDIFRRIKVDSFQTLNILVGKVLMKQENTLFYCDSAIQDLSNNTIEAFGKVHINDSDSIHTYSDYLKYLGETRIATLRDHVKLTDGKAVLTTDELEYDLNAKLGTYLKGGKVVNGKSVLTSTQGYYYADTKDVYFQKNVLLVDPEYIMNTDTLLYNVNTETASFLATTTIRDDKTRIKTKSGFYNLKSGKAKFTNRPILIDSVQMVIADNLIYDKVTGEGTGDGNVFYRDSSQGISMLSGGAFFNTTSKEVTSYKSPVLIIKQDKDNLYMAADTLFSAYQKIETVKQINKIDSANKKDSINPKKSTDSITTKEKSRINQLNNRDKSNNIIKPKIDTDSITTKNSLVVDLMPDSLAKIDQIIKNDSSNNQQTSDTLGNKIRPVFNEPIDSNNIKNIIQLKERTDSLANKDSTASSFMKDSTIKIDSIKQSIADSSKLNAGLIKQKNKSDSIILKDSTLKEVLIDSVRYFKGYHNVRMYSDSIQGKSDSIYYSLLDSTFKFYKDPVIWSNGNQISGDFIMLTTKNKQAHQFIVDQNAISISNTGDGLFNQLKAEKMIGVFKDGEIDSINASINGISLYYLQDDDSAYVGMDYTEANNIIMTFQNRELKKVIWVKGAKGTTYPFNKIPDERRKLPNFRWLEAIRPKSAGELFGK